MFPQLKADILDALAARFDDPEFCNDIKDTLVAQQVGCEYRIFVVACNELERDDYMSVARGAGLAILLMTEKQRARWKAEKNEPVG
jgi:hypothetical protein